ncbi:NAD(P)-dependent dehydrogenase (short-subunit alcohol dehydrogenase family) [Herbihabitans rhizosphaerae]|uniref:NAD(P)-dependent dehydrogenase (Short-subunit alcohol dehydrogenase family) n=1 Tax=Herbihabitans rhizosphaerae TaxID=1872711 RepID=A0A4Q7KJ74_9PSEU|nr:SDR family NAD(P)-dependent oxidoreductase [Herbihabitans rhizosphaerae]RZS36465.1 NAD(P)-dependent dehydrogenase (short-subunit alcohol dehydrogenase family) [Herbihabitans rhizosphaerae]
MPADRSGAALVTGAASGLGLATARLLREHGMPVVVCDQNADLGRRAAEELGATFVSADITDEQAVEQALDTAAALGPVRAVVNCAGIGLPGRVVDHGRPLPLAAFAAVIEVNLVGTFNVTRLGAARMLANEPVDGERGVIVNTSSVAAFDGQIGQAAYAASKAAVAGMTLPLARDLAEHFVRVVTVAPGMFDTPLLAALPDKARRSLETQTPHPARLGRPEEFAALVAHVLANHMINGETIRIDGAIRMAPR